jgi:hypothetical protein
MDESEIQVSCWQRDGPMLTAGCVSPRPNPYPVTVMPRPPAIDPWSVEIDVTTGGSYSKKRPASHSSIRERARQREKRGATCTHKEAERERRIPNSLRAQPRWAPRPRALVPG